MALGCPPPPPPETPIFALNLPESEGVGHGLDSPICGQQNGPKSAWSAHDQAPKTQSDMVLLCVKRKSLNFFIWRKSLIYSFFRRKSSVEKKIENVSYTTYCGNKNSKMLCTRLALFKKQKQATLFWLHDLRFF